jgi:hypothetical protein
MTSTFVSSNRQILSNSVIFRDGICTCIHIADHHFLIDVWSAASKWLIYISLQVQLTLYLLHNGLPFNVP